MPTAGSRWRAHSVVKPSWFDKVYRVVIWSGVVVVAPLTVWILLTRYQSWLGRLLGFAWAIVYVILLATHPAPPQSSPSTVPAQPATSSATVPSAADRLAQARLFASSLADAQADCSRLGRAMVSAIQSGEAVVSYESAINAARACREAADAVKTAKYPAYMSGTSREFLKALRRSAARCL